jgi:hypothetical protein
LRAELCERRFGDPWLLTALSRIAGFVPSLMTVLMSRSDLCSALYDQLFDWGLTFSGATLSRSAFTAGASLPSVRARRRFCQHP